MIKGGNYAIYRGLEYSLTREMESKRIKIYTYEKEKSNETFTYGKLPGGTEYYEKYVQLWELEDTYSVNSYAVVENNRKLLILKESEDKYLVSTGWNDIDLVEKYHLKEEERGVFRGWISKMGVQLVEERQHLCY